LIVVTGGAGFIGSNLVRRLNAAGRDDIVVVDDLSDSRKVDNLRGARLLDYVDKDEFVRLLAEGSSRLAGLELVLHHGACSSTTEPDGRFVMANNYEYSRLVLDGCMDRDARLIYASSAAVYGDATARAGGPRAERPLNVYAWSKLLFDQHVRRVRSQAGASVVGLRYFNVYGPGEDHKGPMSSVIRQFHDQVRHDGRVRLFGASHGLQAGRQARDFIHVDDVVEVVMWFIEHPEVSGTFDCGTGRARTFADVAHLVLAWHGSGEVEHIPFPPDLVDRYQPWTEADLDGLRRVGCDRSFQPIEVGVPRYLEQRVARGAPSSSADGTAG
jgi:ADP-L-glycero-D-manno-heptose 6-epimerase